MECDEGFLPDIEPLSSYYCGEETGYIWNFETEQNPHRRLPFCSGKLSLYMNNQYVQTEIAEHIFLSDIHVCMIRLVGSLRQNQRNIDYFPCDSFHSLYLDMGYQFII